MPKLADHDQRRRQIIAALVDVAASSGLHHVTLRTVAERAGVSVRLVQYYFTDKASLMMAALEHLEGQSNARWTHVRDQVIEQGVPVRAGVEAFLAVAAIDDEQSRVFALVWTSFATMAMTDPALAEHPFTEGPNRLEADLVQLLQLAAARHELAARADGAPADPRLEAARLLNLHHGLGNTVLVGQRTAQQAAEVLRYHLDGLFAA